MSNVELSNEKENSEQKSENYDADSQEEIVDPRVQIELERLNTATDFINKLEIELDEARANFRFLLNDSSIRINELAKRLGSCVEKARPYYEARMRAKQLQAQTQKAALQYERASSAHSAAKEMVYLAEEGLKKEGKCFDPAWQEMLNHATLRVNEAESERVLSQREHQKTSAAYNDAEKVVQKLHHELKKSIVKSSLSTRRSLLQLNNLANQHQLQLLPYFEMKAQFNQLLEEQRKKVHTLEENVLKMKMSYAEALHNLEEISDEIHKKRKNKEGLIDHQSNGAGNSSYTWSGLEIPYRKMTKNSTSCEDIYFDNLNSDDAYLSLPSKLKLRSSTSHSVCDALGIQIAQSKSSGLPDLKEDSNLSRCSNSSEIIGDESINCVRDISSHTKHDSSVISKQLQNLSISNGDSRNCTARNKNKSPNGDELHDHKFLAPDFNILRVQREEISDSESLASNDTGDTLDDNQIECLLLDKDYLLT